MTNLSDFLAPDQQQVVVQAIENAERMTSGEIRLHITPRCWLSPMSQAVKVFHRLGMTATAERNGVLIYIAYRSRKLAIVADSGINERVPANFWDSELDLLRQALRSGHVTEGLCTAIAHIGQKLREYFPHNSNDKDELPNEISYAP